MTALAVLLTSRLATIWVGSSLQQPVATTRDGSLITLNRYVGEPPPDIVLVGSSVTWRLKEEYFATPGVRNLALAGGSPVTSLEIIAKQRGLPKVVLIETNVLSRGVDRALVERFTAARSDALFLRPVRTAIAAYETWNHAPPGPELARAVQRDLIREGPSRFDNRVYVERALKEMNAGDPIEPARENVALIKGLIADIERRGARALLIEIPFSPEIEGSRFVRVTKNIVHGAFPDPNRWLPVDPPSAELRWADGVHLDERSALIVVRSIEEALSTQSRGSRRPD
ncbi:hypothetical protein [Bradyrhizobium sp. Arg816]|uniref:hypothetical protein n=1 Tax=Bradyrhizobium sp. Arg816 TaxID=2998491 RepID=UPI00249DAFCD|nr:hypothetical protein [Bradyrhizobium sp. Arg816]MDI3563917.1 hypothetical protein [Bradyrhizobium sp. Arg816]